MRVEGVLTPHERHHALVMGHNGTTQAEVLLFEAIAPFSVIVRNAALPWLFMGRRFATNNKYWLKFMLDFAFLVVPVLLSLTILAERIAMILLAEGIALVSLFIFYLYEYCYFTPDKPPLKHVVNQVIDDQHTPTIFITYIRSMVLIGTGVAILAVDFDVFPRRFAKTETYGRSVMDVGTASFVFCAAFTNTFRDYPSRIVTRTATPGRFSFLYSSTMMLLYLGVGRSVVLKLLDYPEHVTEYGVHWNFFITLASIRIITKLLGRRFHLLFGVVFAGIYQFLLEEEHLQLVFHTFLTAGFLFVQIASLFGWAAQMPQFSPDENPFELVKPCLLRAVNRRAFAFFIISNLLTGAINIAHIGEYCNGDYEETTVIGIYMLIVCGVIFAFAKRDSIC
ncbi:Phosphatidylinositol-glycan biosynthesis class W protein [Toxocara canis]|uniref:Phosphatidylinositol-glycan biosynthesis class W protein n=1 Tax=Toxocara canis TaxID=6265 RepID=A0A0B2V341_TOXCA|nr:Phosphatidylinositol-glycan biosynthesis class W protein [Toxocara canis]